jgi:hypothetical protein
MTSSQQLASRRLLASRPLLASRLNRDRQGAEPLAETEQWFTPRFTPRFTPQRPKSTATQEKEEKQERMEGRKKRKEVLGAQYAIRDAGMGCVLSASRGRATALSM